MWCSDCGVEIRRGRSRPGIQGMPIADPSSPASASRPQYDRLGFPANLDDS